MRPICKSYPTYAPGREPPGCMEWLGRQEPVVLWDEGAHRPRLTTEADWIAAGKTVFEAPTLRDAYPWRWSASPGFTIRPRCR